MKKLFGFTIIELLIVMAVIAILVGIAVPSFRGIQTEAWKAKAQGDIKVVKIALESYYKTNSAFPAVSNYQATLLSADPKIIESNLYDPFGSTSTTMYTYKLSTNSKYYLIYSVGSSGSGSCTISNAGVVSVTGDAIWISNGSL